MLQASGNKDVKLINPNKGLPLIPYDRGRYHGHDKEKLEEEAAKPVAYNPHTFLSLTGAVQQVYTLARELSELLPGHTKELRDNARAYARRLRRMKADASEKLASAGITRVATVHDGYSYLLQEFSIEVVAVIEPAHGIQPSARELAETIEAIKNAQTPVVLSELNFPPEYVDLIRNATGVRVYAFDHMSTGEYAADRFETSMRANLDTLIKALVTDMEKP